MQQHNSLQGYVLQMTVHAKAQRWILHTVFLPLAHHLRSCQLVKGVPCVHHNLLQVTLLTPKVSSNPLIEGIFPMIVVGNLVDVAFQLHYKFKYRCVYVSWHC